MTMSQAQSEQGNDLPFGHGSHPYDLFGQLSLDPYSFQQSSWSVLVVGEVVVVTYHHSL